MNKVWNKYSPWIHIGVWVFFAGAAWANVASQSNRIDKNEINIQKLIDAMVMQQTTSARIEQKIDYVRQDLQQIREKK